MLDDHRKALETCDISDNSNKILHLNRPYSAMINQRQISIVSDLSKMEGKQTLYLKM